MSDRLKADLVEDALTMALFRRRFPEGVIVHSDRGVQTGIVPMVISTY